MAVRRFHQFFIGVAERPQRKIRYKIDRIILFFDQAEYADRAVMIERVDAAALRFLGYLGRAGYDKQPLVILREWDRMRGRLVLLRPDKGRRPRAGAAAAHP